MTEQLGRVTTVSPAHPHIPRSGQVAGWLGTQRRRACEETMMGAVGGALLAWKGGLRLELPPYPLLWGPWEGQAISQ